MVRSGVDALVEEIADLRPLPAVAAHVLQIAEGDQFSAHELAQAISSDPALTARILRLANSAYYGFPRRITTVRDAVVLLGFRQVRSASLAACAMKALPAGESIQAGPFWQHAVTVGMLAEMLARSAQRHQDEAFTAGVLHNIGRLALDQSRPLEFAEALRLARRQGMTLHEAQYALLGFTDAEVGGALARHWLFPSSLAEAIATHPTAALMDPEARTLGGMVGHAHALSAQHGLGDGVEAVAPRPVLAAACGPAGGHAEDPPLLTLGGGFEALVSRASAFVEHAAVA